MEDLKPCPFCGEPVNLIDKSDNFVNFYTIECLTPDCVSGIIRLYCGWGDKQHTINVWNKRAV